MMRAMNAITDKTDWAKKVFDESITRKWWEEIAQSGQDVTPKMMDWIVKELQWKAEILVNEGLVQVFDNGVVKSDTPVSEEIKAALKEAVMPLQNVPEEQKDYHPGSDNKVVDLVHPSLFPVVFGRTRVLPDRLLGVEDCLDRIGEGTVLPVMESEDNVPAYMGRYPRSNHPAAMSTKFQWLPCDVEWMENGQCRILSYINNAHPVQHRALYGSVERVLAQTFPLWERSLAEPPLEGKRIEYTGVEYMDGYATENEPESVNPPEDPVEAESWTDPQAEWWANRKIKQPEPGEFKVPDPEYDERIDLRSAFPDRTFQVIVKLANIELTPESPDYEGGSWHIEGQLVGTASIIILNFLLTPTERENRRLSNLLLRQQQHHRQLSGLPTQGIALQL